MFPSGAILTVLFLYACKPEPGPSRSAPSAPAATVATAAPATAGAGASGATPAGAASVGAAGAAVTWGQAPAGGAGVPMAGGVAMAGGGMPGGMPGGGRPAAGDAPGGAQAGTDPWVQALQTLTPYVPTETTEALGVLVERHSSERIAGAPTLLAAHHRLLGAVLGDPGSAEAQQALARLRALEEASLRADRAFAWQFFEAAGKEGRTVLISADRVKDLLYMTSVALRERARVEIPHDMDGGESAAAALGAMRYRLAASAAPVDVAADAAIAALRGLDPGDEPRRAEAERRLAVLATAFLDLEGATVSQLAVLHDALGARGWNALARSWNIPAALPGAFVETSLLRPDSVAGGILGTAAGMGAPGMGAAGTGAATDASRRAWEVGQPGGGGDIGGMGGARGAVPGGAPPVGSPP